MALDTTLKQVFQNAYDQNSWINVLTSVFGHSRVRFKANPTPETLSETQHQLAHSVARVGEVNLESGQVLPFFEVELNPKIKVERNRVGINDLVKNLMLRGSTTEGALAVFYYPPEEEKPEWRFSFVSKEAGSEFFNELEQKETKPKRYTYVFGTDEGHKTAIDRFITLSDSGLALDDLFKAFSVQRVSDEFFQEYRNVYLEFVQFLTGKRLQKSKGKYEEEKVQAPSNFLNLVFNNDEKAARDFCKKLIGRVVFLYFLQKKGWLGASIDNENWDDGYNDFLHRLFEESGKQEDFYNQWLSEVFFNTLNTSRSNNAFTMPDGREVKMPYLNGGLFDDSNEPNKHKLIAFPPYLFENLFDLLDSYNFTVYEDSPEDHIVAVDPEMLGHIFENLLEDNKEKGTYYTPKEIVHYMSQESLVEYLYTHLSKPSTKAYRRLGSSQTELFGNEGRKGQLAIEEEIQDDEPSLNRESLERFIKYQYLEEQVTNQQQVIEELMDQVKICDPAIGSGAFPMGLLQEIIQAKEALHEWRVEQNFEDRGDFDPVPIKLNLIQYCIYGVDIEQGAIDIARLRFWLSLVVDEKQPQLLPNLDYKIMQGNSLLESYGDIDLNIDNIQHDLIEDGSKQFTTKDRERLKKLVNDFYLSENVEQKPEIKKEIDGIVQDFIEGCILNSQKKFDKEIEEINRELAFINQQSQKQEKVHQKHENRKNTLKKQLEKVTQERNKLQQQANELREMFKKQEFNFFLWHLWFQDVFQQGGFDIVIANPPYIEHKKLKHIAKELKHKYEVYSQSSDLSVYFFELAFVLLKKNGQLCFINTNKFFSTEYGKNLRNLLLRNKLNSIVNFEQVEVFKDILVSSAIINATKLTPPKDNNITYTELKKEKYWRQEFKKKLNNDKKVFKQIEFDHKEWTFYPETERAIKKEIDNESIKLEDLSYINIFRGLTTGFDPAFIIDSKTKNELGNPDIVKPLIMGRDIKKFKLSSKERYIINSHNGVKNKRPPINVEKDYPLIFKYLCKIDRKHNFKLSNRTDQGNHWTNLRNCAYLDLFEKPKIVWPLTADKWGFALDNNGYFLTSGGFFLVSEKVPLKYLLAVFNSKLMKYYFKFIGVMTAGGAYTLKKTTVEKFPIVETSNTKPFEILVNYITFLKTQTFSDPHDKLMDSFFEQVLDGLVYELYFPELLKSYDREFFKHLKNLKDLNSDLNDYEKLKVIREEFNRFYDKEHPVRNNVFYLDSIPEIRTIEGKNEDN